MAQYCTVDDIQLILPDGHVIGTNLSDENVTVLSADVSDWILFASSTIDSYLSGIYRVPLVQYKEPDFSANPITFTAKYPDPIPLVCARLAASHIYDEVIMSQQSPNISEWGKNNRALAFDTMRDIQSGLIKLRNQPITNFRFVRGSLYDEPRISRPRELPPTQRQAGQ